MAARRWLPPALFALVALLLVVPALPGLPWSLAGEDMLFFRPPFGGLRPADLGAPSNFLLTDPVEVFHPDLDWIRRTLLNGDLPLWNPFAGSGWPIVHAQQSAPFYPLNWPALVVGAEDGSGLVAALHIALAATGTYLFTRRSLDLPALPAVFAALSFACGSYFVAWMEHPHDNVYALLPFALLTVDGVIRRATLRDAALLAAVLGLGFLGGHPQSIVILAIPVLAFAALRLARSEARRRPLLLLGLGGAGGLLAGAIMVVPFAEILGEAKELSRGGFGGLGPRTLLSLVMPDRWGRPDWAFQEPGFSLGENYLERTIYVGAPALILAIAGLTVRRTPEQRLFAGLAVVGLVLPLDLPGVIWFVEHVPPFSQVSMVRSLVIAAFALAVLAAFGLQRWLEGSAPERRRMLFWAGGVAALPILWLVTHPSSLTAVPDAVGAFGDRATDIRDAATGGAAAAVRWIAVSAVLLGLLLLAYKRPRAGAAVAALVLALQAADLVQQGRGIHPVVPSRQAEIGSTPVIDVARAAAGDGRVIGEGAMLSANLATRFRLRDARIREQPRLRRYWKLWLAYTKGAGDPISFQYQQPGSQQLLDAFGVTALLNPAGFPLPPGMEVRYAGPDGSAVANPTALPRAYVATAWRTARDEDDAIARTVASTTDELRSAPVVEGVAEPSAAAAGADGTARILVDGDSRVELAVRSPGPARLILLDSYFPGWRATVDGRSVPIRATNGTFRSIAIGAGDSHVAFTYRPASLAIGVALSTLAWLGIAALLLAPAVPSFVARRRRRFDEAPAAASGRD
jgi:hypothetical protein